MIWVLANGVTTTLLSKVGLWQILVAEIAVVLLELVFYLYMLECGFRRALLISVFCNVASFIVVLAASVAFQSTVVAYYAIDDSQYTEQVHDVKFRDSGWANDYYVFQPLALILCFIGTVLIEGAALCALLREPIRWRSLTRSLTVHLVSYPFLFLCIVLFMSPRPG